MQRGVDYLSEEPFAKVLLIQRVDLRQRRGTIFKRKRIGLIFAPIAIILWIFGWCLSSVGAAHNPKEKAKLNHGSITKL